MGNQKTYKGTKGLTRRQLITALTASTTSLAAGNALGGSIPSPETKNKTHGHDYDAIVIGGGFAGITAARELAKDGYRVAVLEARSRLGGRTFTSRYAGHQIEFGGKWIHWLQPHVWAEITRYGLELVPSPRSNPDRAVFINRKGTRREEPPEKLIHQLAVATQQASSGALKHFPQAYSPLLMESVNQLDQVSIQEHLESLSGISEDQKDMVNAIWVLLAGGKTSEAALTQALRIYSAAGWGFYGYMDTMSHYRFANGTISLINAMLNDGGTKIEVHLSTPVSKISRKGKQVVVTTEEGQTLSAPVCISTVPVNTMRFIDFEPGLPADKRSIADTGQMCRGFKCYALLKENIGNFVGLASEGTPFNLLQTEYYGPDEGTILLGFGGRDELLDINDHDAVTQAINQYLPDVTVLSSAGYDWNSDPFSLGAWAGFRVGELTKRFHALQRAEERLLFGGAITANGWFQFIDGAIESGLRTAREARQIIG